MSASSSMQNSSRNNTQPRFDGHFFETSLALACTITICHFLCRLWLCLHGLHKKTQINLSTIPFSSSSLQIYNELKEGSHQKTWLSYNRILFYNYDNKIGVKNIKWTLFKITCLSPTTYLEAILPIGSKLGGDVRTNAVKFYIGIK